MDKYFLKVGMYVLLAIAALVSAILNLFQNDLYNLKGQAALWAFIASLQWFRQAIREDK